MIKVFCPLYSRVRLLMSLGTFAFVVNENKNYHLLFTSTVSVAQRLVGPSKQLKQIFNMTITLLRISTDQRQTSWLFTSVAEDLNSGEPGTTCLRVRLGDHSATLSPFFSCSCSLYSVFTTKQTPSQRQCQRFV